MRPSVLRMLDVTKLAALAAIDEHGSFSAAARALHLTQPAVSRQVALLERALGATLLHRNAGGVRPTPAGVLLLEHARAVLDRLALAEAQVRALAGVHDGRVRVGSFFTALVHLSAEAGALLAERTPGVVVVDDLVDPATALARLARGELDLAVVFDHDFAPAAAPDGITLAPLFDDPVRLLVPAGHPLAATGRPIALAALAGETVLRSHDGEAARLTDHLLSAAGVNPELLAAGHGDEPVETQALVAAGRGVAFTYELTVLVSRHPLAVLPLADPPATRRVFLAHLDGPMPPPVAAVRDALVAAGAARRPATGPAPRRAALQRPLA